MGESPLERTPIHCALSSSQVKRKKKWGKMRVSTWITLCGPWENPIRGNRRRLVSCMYVWECGCVCVCGQSNNFHSHGFLHRASGKSHRRLATLPQLFCQVQQQSSGAPLSLAGAGVEAGVAGRSTLSEFQDLVLGCVRVYKTAR